MGKYSIDISKEAKKHLKLHYSSGNKSVIKNIERIFNELKENPYEGTGEPELLKYDFEGCWSRRLNKKDRIVYRVNEDIVTVIVISTKGHYKDK